MRSSVCDFNHGTGVIDHGISIICLVVCRWICQIWKWLKRDCRDPESIRKRKKKVLSIAKGLLPIIGQGKLKVFSADCSKGAGFGV